MKKPLPTDLEILDAIYERYSDTFKAYDRPDGHERRGTKVYVPIDIERIASDFQVDPDIVFGRLYYHLDQKHRYRQDAAAEVNAAVRRQVRRDRAHQQPHQADSDGDA